MRETYSLRLFALVSVLASLGSAPAVALEGLRPLDRPWEQEEDKGFRIEWKGTWEATRDSNRERWWKELEATVRDRWSRQRLFASRMMKLYAALAERDPQDVAKRILACQGIAEAFEWIGCRGTANYHRKKILEEFPGNLNVAAEALLRILQGTWRETRRTEEGEEWVEYAASRLIGMNRAGSLPDGHPALALAWKARFEQGLRQHRFWEASQALEPLAVHTGRDDYWSNAKAELFFQAGRGQQALGLFDDLLRRKVEGPAGERVRQLSAGVDTGPAVLPTVSSLDMTWDGIRSGRTVPEASVLRPLFEKGAKEDLLIPWERPCYTSLWIGVDRHLRAAGAPPRLREAQQADAGRRIREARETNDPQTILAACRRYPWARDAHETILELGEQALRRGHSGLALRSFEDVLSHTADASTRAQAQVGVWLALANEARDTEEFRTALAAASQGVGEDAPVPWLGGRALAGVVKERLLAAPRQAANGPPPLAKLDRRELRVPPISPWLADRFLGFEEYLRGRFSPPPGCVQAAAGKVLFSGPNLLAVYGDDLTKPLWRRTAQGLTERIAEEGIPQSCITLGGPFLPALADRRIYTRWGLDPSYQHSTGLAAFDAETGEMLWATHRDAALEDLWPISNPVIADGRLYALAARASYSSMRQVFLLCLDAERGSALWKRSLGSQNVGLFRAEGSPYLPREEVDTSSYGSALTVRRGAVYCLTSTGFVARCDARDGLVEWARVYPRVRLGGNIFNTLRRQGAAPVLVGNATVFLPRDYEGAFALDTETGGLLWDAPFVPSDEAVGTGGGQVLLKDKDHVAALDASSGKMAWERRFDGGIRGRPVLVGSSLYVATPNRLVRVAAETGAVVEERPWAPGAPPDALIFRYGSIIALTDASLAPPSDAPLNPHAAAGPLRLPLQRMWRLPRPHPTILVPPAEAKVQNRLYLLSEGVLECLAADPQGSILWQRTIPRDFFAAQWAEKTMLLVYPERVLALDATTGERRWQAELPFRARDCGVCGPDLLVGDLRDGRHTSLLRISSGELLWHRQFRESLGDGYRGSFDAFGWDGANLHLLMSEFREGDPTPADLTVRPADGRILAYRRFPGGNERWPQKMAVGDGFAVGISRSRFAYTYSFRDGSMVRHQADLSRIDADRIEKIEIAGPWIQILSRRDGGEQPHTCWILRRDDPAYKLRRENGGRITGDTLYETSDRKQSVAAVDLRTRKEVAYRIPTHPDRFRNIQAVHEVGDAVWVISGEGYGWGPTECSVRVDVFDRRAPEAGDGSGRHLATQTLPDVLFGDIHAAWSNDVLFITDTHGLHALVAQPPGEKPRRPFHVAYRTEAPPRMEGSPDDWKNASTIELTASRTPGETPPGGAAPSGKLHIAHDAASLYLAVHCRDDCFLPRVGPSGCGGGDSLEVGLTTHLGTFRWGVGLDPLGRIVWDSFGSERIPKGIRASIHPEAGGQGLLYELAIPKEAIFRSDDPACRRMGLSLVAWEDRRAGTGPARVLGLGGALDGPQLLHTAQKNVYLDSLTHEQHEAAQTITRELPDLPAALALFERGCQSRADSPDEFAEYVWEFIQSHPRSTSVEPLLHRIDRKLRQRSAGDPTPEILRRAARAGVPESVRRRYELQTRANLSQWVYLAKGDRPRSLMIELSDGMSAFDPWHHRAYWGEPAGWWPDPPTWLGKREDLPQEAWHELRIPLYAIDMHDKPICGISFREQGRTRITWDRSALVADGQDRVFLGDDLPKGLTRGTWEWVGQPVRSGAKAHTQTPPGNEGIRAHSVEFESPITDHLVPPVDGPCLSQWVFLDPANPPTMLSLDLHDGTQWCACAIWGAKKRRGRYIGPLPEPGEWHELRLPLAWTPFLARPIVGLAFGHLGGRVFWDRTVLVVDGKEHVLIDGEAPPVRAGEQKREWLGWLDTEAIRYIGNTVPAPGKLGVGLRCDGRTGYADVPHADALDPVNLTVEAWVYVEKHPTEGETRRWIANKNWHESTDGHYAIVLNRDQAGAYLNIGGGDENRKEAWSGPGTIQLKRWHHLAMTYDGADLRLYVDGEEAASAAVNKPRNPGNTSFQIGRRQDGFVYFDGIVDEVRVYSRALSAEQIKARHASAGGSPAKDVDDAVVGTWGFDGEAAGADPVPRWQWVEQPARNGRKAHTDPPATGFAGHFACPLKEPILQQLPFDVAHATEVLKTHVPRLGMADEGWGLFQGLLGLHADARERVDLCKWFLGALPGHPRQADALGALLESCREAGDPDPTGSVEAFVKERAVALPTLYHYRRRYVCPSLTPGQAWPLLLAPFLALRTEKPLPARWAEGAVDLLAPVDTAADVVSGEWRALDGQIASSSRTRYARFELSAAPQRSYTLEVQFTRAEGDCVAVMLPVGDTGALLVVSGWGGTVSGLAFLNRKDANANETTRDGRLADSVKHTLLANVLLLERDQARIRVTLDGGPYIDWQGPRAAFSPDRAWSPRHPGALGLGAYEAIVVFHSCQLKMINGKANPTR